MFTDTNPKSFEVGEVFALEALESGRSDLVVCVLEFWRDLNKGVDVGVSISTTDRYNILMSKKMFWSCYPRPWKTLQVN